MRAYKIIDHEYDVVVLGAGGSGLRACRWPIRSWIKNSLYFKSISN
jgi:ribulose 1,5-bisphosphate synthetase/thiazole synthase